MIWSARRKINKNPNLDKGDKKLSQPITEKTFHTGAIELNYAEGAENGPAFALLHGGSANWYNFESNVI